jgi:hypothetical protein
MVMATRLPSYRGTFFPSREKGRRTSFRFA